MTSPIPTRVSHSLAPLLLLTVPLACSGKRVGNSEQETLRDFPSVPIESRGAGGDGVGGAGAGGSGAASIVSGGSSTGGANSTGGTSTGGAGSGTQAIELKEFTPFSLGQVDMPLADVPQAGGTTCTPPCSIDFALNPGSFIDDTTIGAFLYIDLEEGVVTLSQQASDDLGDFRLSFTYEDNQYGYGSWMTGKTTDVYSINYGWDVEYSVWQDEIIFTEYMIFGGIPLQLAYSYGEKLVRIHSLATPTCQQEGAGVCENAIDCPLVDSAQREELSSSCEDCYAGVDSCTALHCADSCPGGGGNACMRCQVDAGCHQDFMDCSGLHYLPPASLIFPR